MLVNKPKLLNMGRHFIAVKKHFLYLYLGIHFTPFVSRSLDLNSSQQKPVATRHTKTEYPNRFQPVVQYFQCTAAANSLARFYPLPRQRYIICLYNSSTVDRYVTLSAFLNAALQHAGIKRDRHKTYNNIANSQKVKYLL